MKKIFILCAFAVLSLSLSAQLAWDTEFKQADFNNAQTVISKTENVSWKNGVFGLGAHLAIGKIIIIGNAYNDECVIALPQIGIAQKLYFAWQGASNGTITVYQSPDHNNWQQIFSTEGNTIASNKADSAVLSTSTRYIKFAATGRTAAAFSNIRVSELKSLSVGIEEWEPAAAMVDDPVATKNVTVSWTNIVASVTSTDPHFSASVETVGQKNLVDQKTTIRMRKPVRIPARSSSRVKDVRRASLSPVRRPNTTRRSLGRRPSVSVSPPMNLVSMPSLPPAWRSFIRPLTRQSLR